MIPEIKSPLVKKAVAAVVAELEGAMDTHAPMNSAHEAYAVILEEVEEFWAEVMKRKSVRSTYQMRLELQQIAAMAIRAMVDVLPMELDTSDIPF